MPFDIDITKFGFRNEGDFPPRAEEAAKMLRLALRIKAKDRAKRVAKLKDAANFEHSLSIQHRGQARDHDRQRLEHAKLAGDALCKLKKLHRKKGTWQPWLKDNFKGSIRTARVYMQLSAMWDDPDVKKAMKMGTVTSIKTFLDTAKKPKPKGHEVPKESQPMELTDEQIIRADLKHSLAGGLRKLSKDELQKFDEYAPELWDEVLKLFKQKTLPPHLRRAVEEYKQYLVYFDPVYGFETLADQEQADEEFMETIATRSLPVVKPKATRSLRPKSALQPTRPTTKNKRKHKD